MVSKNTLKALAVGGALILSAAAGFFAGNNKTAWYEKLPPAAKQAITIAQYQAEIDLNGCVELLQKGNVVDAHIKYEKVRQTLDSLEHSSPTYHLLKSQVEGFETLLNHVESFLTSLGNQSKLNDIMFKDLAHSEQPKKLTIKEQQYAEDKVVSMTLNVRIALTTATAFEHDVHRIYENTHDGKLVHAMMEAFDRAITDNVELINDTKRRLQAKDSISMSENNGVLRVYGDNVKYLENHRNALREMMRKF